MTSASELVAAHALTKRYGSHPVLTGLDLSVGPGECLALLGRNGAGKTTFLKIVLGLVFPTSGEVQILGGRPGGARQDLAYLPEDVALYPHLSAGDNVRVAAYSAGVSLSSRRVSEILAQLSLSDSGGKPAREFSLGMKRRLQLGMAILVRPARLYVLDEPTNGLDISGMLWFVDRLADLTRDGASVLLASHALGDLEKRITHYAILDGGTIVKNERWNPSARPIAGWCVGVPAEQAERAARLLEESCRAVGSQIRVARRAGGVELVGPLTYADLSTLLARIPVEPVSVGPLAESLSDIFLAAVGDERP